MKLKFDKNQSYQLEAIQSVIDLFEGQPLNRSDFEFSASGDANGSVAFTETGIGNKLVLSKIELLNNLVTVQTGNRLRPDEISKSLTLLRYNEPDGTTVETTFPNYSIEMETGTGKTYVYLRSVYELNKVYGFKKFVIVAPSVAIREGVLKSLRITADHFREIYGNEPMGFKVYDPNHLADLRNFAKNNAIQILVINIDSFAKDMNVINQVRETGLKPIGFIQNSKPIVIIDEPQNMETDIRKKAIANLNPLFTLRYSATHKNLYNLVYKLDPVKAYDLGLVKQIEVDSVVARNDSSGAFISVDGFKVAKQSVNVKLTIFVKGKNAVQKQQVAAGAGDDLYQLSKGHDIYREGFVINEVDAGNGYIRFSNGNAVYKGQAAGGLTDHILKEMIDATVENHFKKEKELKSRGIKVLSLFFIDRVANYRTYDGQGNAEKGKLALWFEESFTKWKNKQAYRGLINCNSEEVHDGYFSQDKGKIKDSREGRATKADDETFRLIMQDKERLLDVNTPLRFIFSHSALREGWDNPNVFQICTLNESRSDIKKRQEIGRGLRLCVDQTGMRNTGREVNRLTVIANEAYDSFSRALQREIEDDCGVKFEGRIKNARARIKVSLKNDWHEDSLFLELWAKINQHTEYTVNYNTQDLISNCIKALQTMPPIEKPVIYREQHIARFIRDAKENLIELSGGQTGSKESIVEDVDYDIHDFVGCIQSKTGLTRDTVSQIVTQSTRLGELFNNPQLFMDTVAGLIKQELDRIKINDIRYERISGQAHAIKIFEDAQTEQYLENLIAVKDQSKTLCNYIAIDPLNMPERKFAADCDALEDILFYIKLPKTFRIKTPLGYYTPGWALLKKDGAGEKRTCFVVETKVSKAVKNRMLLRDSEPMKILCAEKHFAAIDDVHYLVTESVNDLKVS
jgi:type III restriction enzyme